MLKPLMLVHWFLTMQCFSKFCSTKRRLLTYVVIDVK